MFVPRRFAKTRLLGMPGVLDRDMDRAAMFVSRKERNAALFHLGLGSLSPEELVWVSLKERNGDER